MKIVSGNTHINWFFKALKEFEFLIDCATGEDRKSMTIGLLSIKDQRMTGLRITNEFRSIPDS
jgi:hypothetical protein